MKRIISLILCLLMIVPTMVTAVFAADKAPEKTNIALNGRTYHSSIWNNDSSAKFINNGLRNHSYQFWRPNSIQRPDGEGTDDKLQYCGMSFNAYYTTDEIHIYADKYGNVKGGFCAKCKEQFTEAQLINKIYEKNDKGEDVLKSGVCPNTDCKTGVKLTYNDTNNIKYTVKVLVQGQWIEAGVGYNNDAVYYVEDDKVVGNVGIVTIKFNKVFPQFDSKGNVIMNGDERALTTYATTKNIKIECTEYGSYNSDPNYFYVHDWWKVPIIHEVEAMGYKTDDEGDEFYRPKFDVPEGAEVVSDAALGGMANATSSQVTRNPGLGNDRDSGSYWMAKNKVTSGASESFWVDFDTTFTINTIYLNFGGVKEDHANIDLTFDIEIKVDGKWTNVTTGKKAKTSQALWEADDLFKQGLGGDKKVTGIKVTFTSAKQGGADAKPILTEISAPITNGEQCVFLSQYLNANRKISTAQGNLACYGEAIASSNMDYSGISDPSYINDGKVNPNDHSWIARDFLKGTWCGVKLKETHKVSKVVLFFNDPITEGKPEEHIMSFDVEALVNGEYQVIASATSYDEDRKQAIVSINIENPVETSEIRIVFKSYGLVFPYLKEMEIYESDFVYGAYQGYPLDGSRTLNGKPITEVFGEKTLPRRSFYLDMISPIEYFEIVMKYGVNVLDFI